VKFKEIAWGKKLQARFVYQEGDIYYCILNELTKKEPKDSFNV